MSHGVTIEMMNQGGQPITEPTPVISLSISISLTVLLINKKKTFEKSHDWVISFPVWSSSGSNTHLLEIRYDLVQHLEYGGQIRADGKHPKIKNTPTITPDRPSLSILRMLQHVCLSLHRIVSANFHFPPFPAQQKN